LTLNSASSVFIARRSASARSRAALRSGSLLRVSIGVEK
jgi:hypothetical protein